MIAFLKHLPTYTATYCCLFSNTRKRLSTLIIRKTYWWYEDSYVHINTEVVLEWKMQSIALLRCWKTKLNCYALMLLRCMLVCWCAGFGIPCLRGRGFESRCTQFFSLGRGSVAWLCKLSQSQPRSKWVPGEIWEGKQEGCAKAQDGWPPTPHCTSWLKGQETEISTAGTDCKV